MKEESKKKTSIAVRPEPVEGQTNSQRIEEASLEQRLALFDPVRHGAETMVVEQSGAEKEAKV